MFNIDLVATVDVLGNELLVENMDVGLGRCPGTTSKSGGSCIEQQPDLRLRCGLEGLPALNELGVIALKRAERSEEHTSELQSLMRISYAVFCLKKKNEIRPNDDKTV